MEGSIISSIGVEIIGVMSPVSICMLLVVLLVYILSPPSSLYSPPIRTAANLLYLETPSDSTAQKLEGVLLNAVVFVILIAAVTFLVVVLYYYNYTNCLKNYMRFSAFFVLATMGGSIFLSIVEHFSIPIDAITSFLLLLNFTAVGVLSVFGAGIPILLRQVYMVLLGVIVAIWFTKLPEWTTWGLLVALAVYDLAAVLAPGGPLKLLVELSSSRDEELPALIYEARSTVSQNRVEGRAALGFLIGGVSDSDSVELQQVSHFEIQGRAMEEGEIVRDEEEISPLVPSNPEMEIVIDGETSPLVENERTSMVLEKGIKLGLGDFIFYSVLVGRAAMYDLMTVYACYLAIISGLGCTLVLLSVCRQALPALPISITVGVMFYFLTRLLMEPFVIGTATNLLMF